jgi:hypothetical protein
MNNNLVTVVVLYEPIMIMNLSNLTFDIWYVLLIQFLLLIVNNNSFSFTNLKLLEPSF